MRETICAQITAKEKSAVGIIRLSGKDTKKIAKNILGFVPKPKVAYFSSFKNIHSNILDKGIVIFFSAKSSFTGEDVLELQGHGGVAVMSMLLEMCLEYGARLADAGEFSKRAFLNNKIDLIQAEAVADLISAESKQQAYSALRSIMGGFSKSINSIVDKVINIRTLIEANIDFSDEGRY